MNHAVVQNNTLTDDSGVSLDDTATSTGSTTIDETGTNSNQSSSSSVVPLMSSMPTTDRQMVIVMPPQLPLPTSADQQQQQQLLHPINSFETFCTVPGRLTLLSNQKKYRVSIGEVRRRMGPPECMNASILGGILRKAKNKHGGQLLREQLHVYGVELSLGRRKQSALSCFSSLVEEEAVQMANDFQTICQRDYPTKAVAKHSISDVNSAQEAYVRRMELFYANKLLNRILDFHKADKSSMTIMEQIQAGAGLSSAAEVKSGLNHFDLITHGFGSLAMKAVLETVIRAINEQQNLLV